MASVQDATVSRHVSLGLLDSHSLTSIASGDDSDHVDHHGLRTFRSDVHGNAMIWLEEKAPATAAECTPSRQSAKEGVPGDLLGSHAKHESSKEQLSMLDLRRKRNRDSMRRARIRQRAEYNRMQSMIDQLERQLRHMVKESEKKHLESGLREETNYGFHASYSRLLLQTDRLQKEQMRLTSTLNQHMMFHQKILRSTDQLRLEISDQLEQDIQQQLQDETGRITTDPSVQPLLEWLNTPEKINELIQFGCEMMHKNAAFTDSLVQQPNSVLGWCDRRFVNGNWAHFVESKDFMHESAEVLSKRTWEAASAVGKLSQFIKWAHGVTVLHVLSEEAAILAHDLDIPTSPDSELPTRMRWTLLAYRARTPEGFIVCAQTINIHGTTIEECLDTKLMPQGIRLKTMHGLIFSRLPSTSTGESIGCNVQMAGKTGAGDLAFAHTIVREALPSVLRWENTMVGAIFRITG